MRQPRTHRRGSAMIMAILFVCIFSVLALSFSTVSDVSVQMSENHRDVVRAQAAAESGLACVQGLISGYAPMRTPYNTVSEAEARANFVALAQYVQGRVQGVGGTATLAGDRLSIGATGLGDGSTVAFSAMVEFFPAAGANPHTIVVGSTGLAGSAQRHASLSYVVEKESGILEYAIASRGRMMITGDTTVNGDVYSSWGQSQWAAPFETSSQTTLNGKLSTLLTDEELAASGYVMETLDEDGNPTYGPYDTLQGVYEGVEYGVVHDDMPGLSIEDYNTDLYADMTHTLPASGRTTVEYFPHAPGHYDLPASRSSRSFNRQVYEGRTYRDVKMPSGRSALFKDCVFEGILYIGQGGNGANNVRFENCVFKGPIVTGVPTQFDWMGNCLYFTGTADFQNEVMPETTILAPHFNVNLGNTRAVLPGDNCELTGAIVGGIVDVRGNARIDGTIISMYDTSPHPLGYVTNIGFADDGGSESSALDPADDIGVINITPNPSRLLPSGMVTPIVMHCNANSYYEYF